MSLGLLGGNGLCSVEVGNGLLLSSSGMNSTDETGRFRHGVALQRL